MKTSTYLSSSAFLLGVCALGHALISMGTTRWRYNVITGQEFGLFETCSGRRISCEITINNDEDYVKATASFMVIGCTFLLTALICSLFAIFDKRTKAYKLATAFYLIGGLLLLIAPAVYTGVVRNAGSALIDFGFSIWLSWASVAIGILAGVVQALGIPRKNYSA